MASLSRAQLRAASAAVLAVCIQGEALAGRPEPPDDVRVFSTGAADAASLTIVLSGDAAAATLPAPAAGPTLGFAPADAPPPRIETAAPPVEAAALQPQAAPPTTGTATFDTTLTGDFGYGGLLVGGASGKDQEKVSARGEVTADFGAGTIGGTFPDADFVVDGVQLETTRLGQDFGLTFQGNTTGDGFDTIVYTSRRQGPGVAGSFLDMIGEGKGTFSGPADKPSKIQGSLNMFSTAPDLAADMSATFEGGLAQPAAVPDIPTTGVATFDTGLTGTLSYDSVPLANEQLIFGRGDVSVDFGAGTLSGEIPDVDFVNQGKISEKDALLGQDFGIGLNGTVQGGRLEVSGFTAGAVGALDLDGSGSGEITAAPGQLQIGGSVDLINRNGDLPVTVKAGFEGVAPPP